MAGEDKPPDSGGQFTSYAERAKMNIKYSQRLKRNILEIEVEKENEEDEMILSDETIATLLNKLRLNINSHVEGCQVNYGRKKSKIEVWCRAGLDLEQFCMNESLQVEKGVRTNFIRPVGRKDVEVSVVGLGFNTPDSLVQEYIKKFGGKLVTNDVIYGKFSSGPLQGKMNGVRKYRVDLTKLNTSMGTFHLLDGNKVKVYFRGNGTCGWCHKDVTKCPGGAKAETCKEKGTGQVNLRDHMHTLWDTIGFDPQTFEISDPEYDDLDSSDSIGGDRKVLKTVHFPRQVDRSPISESDKFTTVRLRNFPLEICDEEIVKFLKKEVSVEISELDIKSEKTPYSTNITLGPGPNLDVIAKVIEVIDYKTTAKTFFDDRKIHVQLHRPLTPKKVEESAEEKESVKKPEVNQSGSVSRIPKDTVKAAIKDINSVKQVPATPKGKAGSNTNASSGFTSAIS